LQLFEKNYSYYRLLKIYLNMKKFLNIAALMCCALLFFCGCGKQTDYTEYISEKRTDIYLYSDEGRGRPYKQLDGS